MRVTHKGHIKNWSIFVTLWDQLAISSLVMLRDNSLVYSNLWHALTPVTVITES